MVSKLLVKTSPMKHVINISLVIQFNLNKAKCETKTTNSIIYKSQPLNTNINIYVIFIFSKRYYLCLATLIRPSSHSGTLETTQCSLKLQ